ncbi:Mur ligase family protein [uncultured Agrococcus sp.]|uniref:Mur ligase family protein n=1 Tax=uncultured Agrococcus sp. TaxID=382258 RepID=UPI0025DD1AAC|nr:Mur ligase family protein [uncultured Agrococcus sp.]
MPALPVITGKLALRALRLLGRSGNALPGLIVERTFPAYLSKTLSALPHGVVLVTGTNGKTTTTKMIATILGRRFRVLTNDTGSNFVRGAIGALVDSSSWAGKLDADIAVFELDEAHAVKFVERHRPDHVLLLNVSRDQLDRFGEIDFTASLLERVGQAATASVTLNADDERLAAMAGRMNADVHWFALSEEMQQHFPTDEELYGDVETQPVPVGMDAVLESYEATSGETTIDFEGDVRTVRLRTSGAHNAQNATAAAVVSRVAGLTVDEVTEGLAEVEPAFGRGQAYRIDGRDVRMHLVKNPAGFRQSLQAGLGEQPDRATIIINDADADGRDMSWLWDVPFVPLLDAGIPVTTGGVRAADMAVRLKYEGLEVEYDRAELAPVVDEAIARTPEGGRLAVFASYTAMWGLFRHLETRSGGTA